MRAAGVRQHQGVLAVLVLEVVVDTLFFHQAADEVEVGLAVLGAVGPRPIRSAERV